MGGKCENSEGDVTEHIRSLGFRDMREEVTSRRVTLWWVRVYLPIDLPKGGKLIVAYRPRTKIVHMNRILLTIVEILELSIKSLKEGRNHRFDPSLRNLFIKSSLVHSGLEPILKVG
jgi:hypothetical protein